VQPISLLMRTFYRILIKKISPMFASVGVSLKGTYCRIIIMSKHILKQLWGGN